MCIFNYLYAICMLVCGCTNNKKHDYEKYQSVASVNACAVDGLFLVI